MKKNVGQFPGNDRGNLDASRFTFYLQQVSLTAYISIIPSAVFTKHCRAFATFLSKWYFLSQMCHFWSLINLVLFGLSALQSPN